MRLRIICLVLFLGIIIFILEAFSGPIKQIFENHFLLKQLFQYPSDGAKEQEAGVEDPKLLETIYVTILGNDPQYGYSFEEMNGLTREESLEKDPQLPILFQTELEPLNLDEAGVETLTPNATIEQRGQSTRRAILKSYKIRLARELELWNNQRIINLNKHPNDFTSVRNKLSFDYFKLIPNLVSSETQFVRLYVRDLTSASGDKNFIDYGLFTHTEQIDKDFLRRHGLDQDGYLYKVVNFEFYRYPELLRPHYDPFYDRGKFETILAIRGREYHDHFLQMLDDVNNFALDFNRVFEKYFDKDNFLVWIAVNMLIGNLDSSSNNFYLYSSRFSNKWYFVPWDYDGAWDFYWQWSTDPKKLHPTREGLSLYWGWPLVRRFFQQPENLAALNEKIEEVALIITEERTKAFLDEYFPIVRLLTLQLPDVQLLPHNIERFDEEYYSLVQVPEKRREKYYTLLHKPMPIFVGGPWINEDRMTFTWWDSFSLQGNEIYYDLQISHDPVFSVLYFEVKDLQDTAWTMEILPAGSYYWRIIIHDSQGNKQIPFESLTVNNTLYHGVKAFTIEEGGVLHGI